ncbi:MAG: four helix bundle protein, partial [Bacteroidales bacterium]|nr:four helix bundle protein [Bacteroidales bacterium]
MAKFTKFEDMQAWQKASKLSNVLYRLTEPEKYKNDYALIRQIRRSGGSIMDNIAEGFGRGGNKEFIHFLSSSMGSAFELKSQLYRAIDQNYIS